MENNNVEFIQSDFIQETAKQLDKIFPPKDVQVLLNETKKILDKVEELKNKWQQMNETAFQENPIFAKRKGEEEEHASKTATAYQLLWNNDEYQYQDMLQIIIEAELFIDRVRQFFTGQKISYSVGVRYEGQLYEYNLTLMDVLSNAVIGIDAKNQGLKLRIAKSKSSLIKAYGELRAAGRESEVTIDSDKEQLNSNNELFDAIYTYWKDNGKTIDGIKVNEGQLYETYRFIMSEGKYNTFNPDSKKDIAYLKTAATRTVKNVTSGRQGGDVEDAQVKFFNASFASLGEIYNTLSELYKILNNFITTNHKNEFKQGMKKLFTKNKKDIEKIEEGIQRDAKKKIDDVIKSISGISFT